MRSKLVVAGVAMLLIASGLFAARQVLKDEPEGNADLAADGATAATAETAVSKCGAPGPDGGGDSDTIPDCLASGGGFLRSDVNDDNITDLILGVPFEDVGGVVDAGAVLVFYGGADIGTKAPDVLTQGSNGIADTPEANDQFGFAITAVDLDCSGKAEIVVGVPFEDVGAAADAGAVHVIFGVSGGRVSGTAPTAVAPATFWTQDTGSVQDSVEAGDMFGYSLAWGFLGTEARDKHLIVGVPSEDLGSIADAGAVHVFRNMCSVTQNIGMTDTDNQFWHQDSPSVGDRAEAGDGFGTALAVGKFVQQTTTAKPSTLVVGVPGEDYEYKTSTNTAETAPDAGLVHLLPGAALAITGTGSAVLAQGRGGLPDSMESGDRFGEELLAKDVTSDDVNDLVIGVPREDIESGGRVYTDAGGFHLLVAAADGSGLATTGSQFLDQAAASETVESGDMFGASLAGLERDGGVVSSGSLSQVFLAVGAPFEDLGRVVDAGVVHTFLGTSTGVTPSQVLTQAGAGEVPESGDRFGFALGEWDYDGSSGPDLAVGAPGEDLMVGQKTFSDAGIVILIRRPTSADAMTSTTSPPLAITQALTPEGIEQGDQFGMSMY